MKILRAFGFGVFLIVLAFLMPAVLLELTETLVVFLKSAAQAFSAAGSIASQAVGNIQ